MHDEKKLALALARLDALRKNIPTEVSEQRVDEYHSMVSELEDASQEDLSGFPIQQEELAPRVTSVRMAINGPGSGGATYSKVKYCDRNLFKRQIEAAWSYLQNVRSSPGREYTTRDYWKMTDEELEHLATSLHIHSISVGPGNAWYVDRVRVIDELIKRDRALNGDARPEQNWINIGTMIGSSVQQGAPHSVSSVNFSHIEPEIKDLLNKIRQSTDQLEISDSARNELMTDVQTVEVQIGSSSPKNSIIFESLHSVRNILEGATGSMLASAILLQLNNILPHLRR